VPGPAGLPTWFDGRTAPPIFAADGSAMEVARAYMADRMPDIAVELDGAGGLDPETGQVRVTWRRAALFSDTGLDDDDIAARYQGQVLLRAFSGRAGFAVIAATTDGVDLSAITIEEGIAAGLVTGEHVDQLFADVVHADGTPLAGSGPPVGDTPQPFGSAGRGTGTLELRPVPLSDGATLRVRMVGGTFLSISELALDVQAIERSTTTTSSSPSQTTTTTTQSASDPVAPWAGAALPASAAPATVEAWRSEGSPGAECPAVAPADLGEGEGATARATTRGQPGAWWVAYDLPGGDGEADIQSPANDVGTETFSVSAIEIDGGSDSVDRVPNELRWSDGSVGSYGPEGDGTLLMPEGVTYPWLAYLRIGDSPCLYQVHSYLGREHVEHLISQLRYVETAP
jgi:hypothetical protein